MKSKICKCCKIDKPITEYYKAKQYKDNIDYYCKYCRTGTSIKSQRRQKADKSCTNGMANCTNPHYSNGMCKNCYERNRRNGHPNLLNLQKTEYKYGKNKYTYEQLRKHHLKYFYDLDMEEYDEMAKDGCHICGKTKVDHKQLHVDHDHKHCSGQKACKICVRGILCDACNVAVGKFEDGSLRLDYPKRDAIVLYVGMHDGLISDRISHYDEEQGNRNG